MPATSCCLQLSVKGGGRGGLFFFFFFQFFWQDWKGRKGVMKRYVWRIEAKGEEASCVAMKRGEEMRAQQRGESLWKKCRVEGFGRAESALMQTLWGASRSHAHTDAPHTHTHTCTLPSSEVCCSTVTNIFHIRMSYWVESVLGTATPCCAVRLLHGLTELD